MIIYKVFNKQTKTSENWTKDPSIAIPNPLPTSHDWRVSMYGAHDFDILIVLGQLLSLGFLVFLRRGWHRTFRRRVLVDPVAFPDGEGSLILILSDDKAGSDRFDAQSFGSFYYWYSLGDHHINETLPFLTQRLHTCNVILEYRFLKGMLFNSKLIIIGKAKGMLLKSREDSSG
jgi:hypothetical protein